MTYNHHIYANMEGKRIDQVIQSPTNPYGNKEGDHNHPNYLSTHVAVEELESIQKIHPARIKRTNEKGLCRADYKSYPLKGIYWDRNLETFSIFKLQVESHYTQVHKDNMIDPRF